ncbi:MAG TPA: 2-oxoglutarate dehydrogenase, E2 component, dihydrolipoamide succinyltransferase [Nocardioidaceae bacterium]|jgi:2-oxoglutarate dehydrogenase E2 component (dihydrolipoamide succinyltransferase)
MATSVTLPALGESVTEGTVTRWLKQPGDQVSVDEPLLEVSTDKVDTEIPSPVAGTLLEIKVQEDETVEVGAELATIGAEGESTGAGAGGGEEAAAEPQQAAQEAPQEQAAPQAAPQQAPQSAVPPASTEPAPPAQETAPAATDTRPEAEASRAGTSAGGGTPVTLPALGESVTEGTVTRWLKQVGDDVAVDEPLLEVSTDKVDTEIPSPVAGKLLSIDVQEDETVEVGAQLAMIGSAEAAPTGGATSENAGAAETPTGQVEERQPQPTADGAPDASSQAPTPSAVPPAAEQVQPDAGAESDTAAPQQAPQQAPAPQHAPPQAAPQPAPAQQAPAQQSSQSADGEAPYVTPLVRKMAADQGVDLSTVKGSGVGGRIRKQDVLEAAKAQQTAQAQPAAPEAPAAAAPAAPAGPSAPTAPAPSPLRGKTEKMSRLRKVIATRMVESLQTSAQLTTVVEVDVTAIARLRDQVKAEFAKREGVKLSFLPFFAKATIDALKEHPALNASIDTEKGEITYFDHENLSVAVDTEKGLLTPVIKDAGDLSVAGLARKIADIAERTRANKIGPDELAGGTFTLTNTGSRGALFDTPIINQPQVAILGTGSVVKRPVVIDDPNLGETIAVRHMVYLALTYDHRLVDGADAARFLSDVKHRLEAGQFEV